MIWSRELKRRSFKWRVLYVYQLNVSGSQQGRHLVVKAPRPGIDLKWGFTRGWLIYIVLLRLWNKLYPFIQTCNMNVYFALVQFTPLKIISTTPKKLFNRWAQSPPQIRNFSYLGKFSWQCCRHQSVLNLALRWRLPLPMHSVIMMMKK
jgi:hypothetical protein